MKITSSRGLFGSLIAAAMLAGGTINAMGRPSRKVLRSVTGNTKTEFDDQRIAAAQAKSDRRAARNIRNGLTK